MQDDHMKLHRIEYIFDSYDGGYSYNFYPRNPPTGSRWEYETIAMWTGEPEIEEVGVKEVLEDLRKRKPSQVIAHYQRNCR